MHTVSRCISVTSPQVFDVANKCEKPKLYKTQSYPNMADDASDCHGSHTHPN